DFTGDALFWKATFSRAAFFGRANFSKAAMFLEATFNGEASFKKATFKESALFEKVYFSGYTNFSVATFRQKANFKQADFNRNVYFQKTKFSKWFVLSGCSSKESIFFEGADLSNVSFLDSDPAKMHFIDCTWPRCFGRNILSDEIKPKDDKFPFDKVEYLYRRLKQKYKEEHNETEASNWHYGEKEMFRKKKLWRRYNPFSFSNLYWVSSGYAERPVRAGLVLISLFVAVTFLMNLLGLVPRHGNPVFGVESIKGFSSVFDPMRFWLLVNNTIQHALFIRDTYFIPQSLAGSIILTISTKVIIPIQTALFVLALRNKFRR
ncbi:unnamed protein product, partial [marine sediment metagenome]